MKRANCIDLSLGKVVTRESLGRGDYLRNYFLLNDLNGLPVPSPKPAERSTAGITGPDSSSDPRGPRNIRTLPRGKATAKSKKKKSQGNHSTSNFQRGKNIQSSQVIKDDDPLFRHTGLQTSCSPPSSGNGGSQGQHLIRGVDSRVAAIEMHEQKLSETSLEYGWCGEQWEDKVNLRHLQLAGPKDRTGRIFDDGTRPRVDIAGIMRVRLAPSPREISVNIACKAVGDVWFEVNAPIPKVQEISADAWFTFRCFAFVSRKTSSPTSGQRGVGARNALRGKSTHQQPRGRPQTAAGKPTSILVEDLCCCWGKTGVNIRADSDTREHTSVSVRPIDGRDISEDVVVMVLYIIAEELIDIPNGMASASVHERAPVQL
ncbi:hypothetical protein THAOC_14074 [Thalassiosira oceanica]|uniref:Uncharacterized protein n=1 Tax=Thalassiosira oceanica TaxID=159749 RepID=K0T431_THAOC|nr:hypothetical protein THAOC_14074 [Thalassiosira oceanica]|eukprot:EJK65112.1 hypothetical protein THAOC_14074 [Thalassiosira oceanica]